MKEFGKRKKEIYYVDIDKASKDLSHSSASGDDGGKSTNATASSDEMQARKVELQSCMARQVGLQREMKRVLQELSNDDLTKKLEEEETVANGLRSRVTAAKGRIETSHDDSGGGGRSSLAKRGANYGTQIRSTFQTKREEDTMTSKQIKTRFNFMRLEWKARKEKCNDFIDNLADAMEKRLKEVHKTLDVVTDQMEGVVLPPKQVIDS